MSGISYILLLVIVIGLNYGSSADVASHLKHSRNRFILHRCTATAELSRKRKNDELPDSSLIQNNEDSSDAQNLSSSAQKNDSRLQTKDSTMSINNHRSEIRGTTFIDKGAKKIVTETVQSTPLKTVDIKTAQNLPPIFRRKSLLPEIEQNISSRKIDTFPNIIIIKPAT